MLVPGKHFGSSSLAKIISFTFGGNNFLALTVTVVVVDVVAVLFDSVLHEVLAFYSFSLHECVCMYVCRVSLLCDPGTHINLAIVFVVFVAFILTRRMYVYV